MQTKEINKKPAYEPKPLFKRLAREVFHLQAALSPAKRKARARWLTKDGPAFIRNIGVDNGAVVVDFGCGFGAYSIPAALLAGTNGLVVAIDERKRALRNVMRIAAAKRMRNIKFARKLEDLSSLLNGRECKAILLYDVLHFMDKSDRMQLYSFFRNILANDGVMSIHPKHMAGDNPSRFFLDMNADKLIHEIECVGFSLNEKKETCLWHDHECIKGTIFNFAPGLKQKK